MASQWKRAASFAAIPSNAITYDTSQSCGGSVRDLLHPAHAESWPITSDGLLPGWLTTILNVAFYAAFCSGAFLFIRGTEGRERLFMVGWWAVMLLSPLRTLSSQWSMTIRCVDTFGLAVALVLAISLILRPLNVTGSSS